MNDNKETLANGHKLNKETFGDFIERLRHHCIGDGVTEHCTADAMFIVQKRERITGLDTDHTDRIGVYDDGYFYNTIEDYIDECCLDEFKNWCKKAYEVEIESSAHEAYSIHYDLDEFVREHNQDATITGYDYEWRYVSSHFTKEAAERFIQRKKHDYGLGLRVCVDAQTYCWEFNAIKEALMKGQLIFNG